MSAVLFIFSAVCLQFQLFVYFCQLFCLHFQLFVYFCQLFCLHFQLFVYIFSCLFTFGQLIVYNLNFRAKNLVFLWLFCHYRCFNQVWIFAPNTLFFHDFFATTDASTKFEFLRQIPCFFMTFLPLQMLQHLNCKLLLKVLDIFGHFCNFSDFQIEFYQLLEFFKGFFHAFISGFPRFSSWGFSDFWTFLPIEIISNNLCFPLHLFLDF